MVIKIQIKRKDMDKSYSYRSAFDEVRNGDTSAFSINRLAICYQLCCASGKRMYDSLSKTAWWKKKWDDNTYYTEKYTEIFHLEYATPFDQWK